jgi:hypothetical protein
MSKFIDKLKEVSEAELKPMGFKAAAKAPPKPKMLLVAAPAEANIESLADYMSGADAGIAPLPKSSAGAKTTPKMPQAMSAIPWGGWLKDISEGKSAEAGYDFVIFPSDTPLATLQDNKAGKILEVDTSLGEGLLKTIDELSVDAVLTLGEKEKGNLLTWRHLMLCQRCAELVSKPLLASVPATVGASELEALWAAGVVGVVVETPPKGRIAELRKIIDKLDFPPPSKQKKIEPLLPRVIEKGGEEEED